MSDWSKPLVLTLVAGQGDSGKTTACFRYLLNQPAAAYFIFDDRGQAAQRLSMRHCNTQKECEAALATRWVCFNPNFMFPGSKLYDGFRWFCKWALAVSQRGTGRKILFVDELWQWVDARSSPDELQDVVRTGRAEELELLNATHSPSEFHISIRRLVTEWICFGMKEPRDLDAVRPYFSGVDRCRNLKKGEFIAYNRNSGGELAGKISW